MTQNNNLSILPFYTSLDEQNHRKPYAYGDIYPLFIPMGMVPPFQVQIPHGSATVSSVVLKRSDGTTFGNITSAMNGAGLTVQRYTSYDYDMVLFPSVAPMGITTKEGQYYLVLTMSDGAVYYSDIFTVCGETGLVVVQWFDLTDLIMDGCRVVYTDMDNQLRYRHTLWLQSQIGKPEYEFEEEGEQRDGFYFAEKMISTKKYKFTFLASEYLCDVMRFISLSDVILVKDQYGRQYRCNTFLMTPKWEVQGNIASVDVEFTCDTVAKRIGYAEPKYGAYNIDFNNDYDI